MLELNESVDYVQPITKLMEEGKYDEARAELEKAPKEWRIAILWTVAAQTGIVL